MACKQRPSFTAEAVTPVVISGISPPFGRLSQARGQVTYVLLTRAPLYSGSCPPFLARLACIRHAASVRSEPGSNSPVKAGEPGDVKRRRDSIRSWNRTVDPVSARLALSECPQLLTARRRASNGTLLPSFQRPTPKNR